jgi:7-cyano-7-deazaguanine synthase in queuosine biosynthesis
MDPAPRDLLLLSGGLDSVCAWAMLGWPPAVFYGLDTAASTHERRAVLRVAEAVGQRVTIDDSLAWIGRFEDKLTGYVPYRNLFFLLAASLRVAPGGRLLIAQVRDEWQRDKNEDFYKETERQIHELHGKRVEIRAPLRHYTKAELVYASGLSPAVLAMTYSCLRGGQEHCGACSNCLNRAWALSGQKPTLRAMLHKAWVQRRSFRWANLGLYWRQLRRSR